MQICGRACKAMRPELAFVAIVLAVLICSTPYQPSPTRLVTSAGAFASCYLIFALRPWSASSSDLIKQCVMVGNQALFFGALLLATISSRVSASERVSHLALTSMSWLAMRPVGKKAQALAMAVQLAQTAVVAGLHARQQHDHTSNAAFLLSAVLASVAVPALLCSGFGDANSRVAGQLMLSRGQRAADEQPHMTMYYAGDCRREQVPSGTSRATTATGSHRSRVMGGQDGCSGADGAGADPAARGCCVSTPFPAQSGSGRCVCYAVKAAATGFAAMITTSCQTDDELLLWLFAGTSNAPSVTDEVRDEPRGSHGGGFSAAHHTQHADPWTHLKEGGRCKGGGRSGGIGKYDSFTSVWSRSAMTVGTLGSVFSSEGDDAGAAGTGLHEAGMSNGSQQGGKQGPAHVLGQAAAAAAQKRCPLPVTTSHPPADGRPYSRHPLPQQQQPPPHPPSQQLVPGNAKPTHPGSRSSAGGGVAAEAQVSLGPASAAGEPQQPLLGAAVAAGGSSEGPTAEATGAAAAASRALQRRQRLQRSSTFSGLSPERSRVLMELAATKGGAPTVLPPPSLDERGLGVSPVAVPSPYSEESEDEAMLQLRAIRSLRRTQPQLAVSLDRFASLLRRQLQQPGAAPPQRQASGTAPTGAHASGSAPACGAPIGAPTAAPTAWHSLQQQQQLERVGAVRRPVRRTRSYSSPRDAAAAPEVSLLRLLFSPCDSAAAPQPPRSSMLTYAPAADPPQPDVGLRSLPPQPQGLAGRPGSAGGELPPASSLDGLPRAPQQPPGGSRPLPAAEGSSRASSHWSHGGLDTSTTTAGERSLSLGRNSVEAHCRSLPSVSAACQARELLMLAAAHGGGADGCLVRCEGRRTSVQRSRSAGETGFRRPPPHPLQLPHQEHRRASLMQAWQALVAKAEAGMHRPHYLAGGGVANGVLSPFTRAPQCHVGHTSAPGLAVIPVVEVTAVPDISQDNALAVATAVPAPADTAEGDCDGGSHIPDGAAAQALPLPAERLRSGAGAPAAAGLAGPAPADERTVRVSKSLSERSLQQRVATAHYRRVARTKSRFALLQQDMSEASGSGHPGAVARNASGGSLRSSALENVLEEQEGEAEGDELLAAGAAAGRGSSGGRRSAEAAAETESARRGRARPSTCPDGSAAGAAELQEADIAEASLPSCVGPVGSGGSGAQLPWSSQQRRSGSGMREGGQLGPRRRSAWRSVSELSFAGMRLSGARRSFGSNDPSVVPSLEDGRHSAGSEAASASAAWMLEGNDSLSRRLAASLSLNGAATRSGSTDGCSAQGIPSLPGRMSSTSGGRRGAAGDSRGGELPAAVISLAHSNSEAGRGGGSGGGGEKCGDSDEELLDVLAVGTRVGGREGDRPAHPLQRLREQPGAVLGRVASFRFAAPAVPGTAPPSVPADASAAARAAVTSLPAKAAASDAPDSDAVPADPGAADIPVPPMATPVVPEVERERSRGRASLDRTAAAPAPAAAAPAAAAPAPLSAQNLHHHTWHWEATSPRARDATVLVLQLPSPSPSQSGPIDPLSDNDGTAAPAPPSAAMLAAMQSVDGAEQCDNGGGGASSHTPGASSSGTSPSSGNNAVSCPVPRAVVAARLSMPLLPYNGDATAIVAAAAAAGVGSAAAANRALSRQPSTTTTVGGRSQGDSSTGMSDSLGPLTTVDEGSAVTCGGMERQPSRSPSVLARSVIVRINSGGTFAGSGVGRPGMTSSLRQPSKLAGGGGGGGMGGVEASVELEVEEAVLANRRMQDDRGTLLDEVNIDKVLGFGSMGMVYHGRLYDTKVVVKLIEHGTGVLGKEKERGRLARVEACVSRLLLHPNIVLTYDACTGRMQPGRLAAKLGRGGGGGGGRQRFMTVMVQEFCELGTLRDAINKRKLGLNGPSPECLPLLYRVALDIANGMKHLAALRIVHADLKAENVLLQRVGASGDRPQGFLAKVADFGLAMVLPGGEEEVRQGIHGTVSHMPPEAMKETVFSLATDVFSFGVVLWELYTTESPYRGMAPHEVVEAVCGRGERPPWPEGTPEELVALAADCWHADPHQRPSFSDVVERLRQLLAPSRTPPERCPSMLSGMTEDSDELEAALRQQRRGAHSNVSGDTARGGAASLSTAGSEGAAMAAAGASRLGGGRGGALTRGSSRCGGGDSCSEGAGVPREAPRDSLGLLLWALCQPPGEGVVRVAGPSPDSVQWVLQVHDMVLRSREGEGGRGDLPAGSTGCSAARAT